MNGGVDEIEIPASLADIVRAIGHSPTLSLIHVYAGGGVYVPTDSRLSDDHPLVRLLGMPLARRLAAAVGGAFIVFPVAQKILWERREAEIARRLAEGATAPEIVRMYGVTRRYVVNVRRRAKKRETAGA